MGCINQDEDRLDEDYPPSPIYDTRNEQKLQTFLLGGRKRKYWDDPGTTRRRLNRPTVLQG
jgi:hypothetical protein